MNTEPSKTKFYYEDKRTAIETPDIESNVSQGSASLIEAHEVLVGYLDYIFKTLEAVDQAYMNRDGGLTVEARLSILSEGISKCLFVISLAESIKTHYPSLSNIIKGVYSSIRFQDVFIYNAIHSELHSGSLFDIGNTSIH